MHAAQVRKNELRSAKRKVLTHIKASPEPLFPFYNHDFRHSKADFIDPIKKSTHFSKNTFAGRQEARMDHPDVD